MGLRSNIPGAIYCQIPLSLPLTCLVVASARLLLQMTLKPSSSQGRACRVEACFKQTWLPSKPPTPPASWRTSYAGTLQRTGTLTPHTPRGAPSQTVWHIRSAHRQDAQAMCKRQSRSSRNSCLLLQCVSLARVSTTAAQLFHFSNTTNLHTALLLPEQTQSKCQSVIAALPKQTHAMPLAGLCHTLDWCCKLPKLHKGFVHTSRTEHA